MTDAKPHRGGRNGSHALQEPELSLFLAKLDARYNQAGSYRRLAAPFNGSPAESTMARWGARKGIPSVDMAARVTEVFDNPGSTQEPLASHHLRDVPTGDHPEPPDPWFDPPPAPTGDHPEPARKILVGIGGVGGSVPGGPLVGGHGGAGGIRQPETTPADIRRMIAEELAGSDLAGSILREAARLIPQIMLGDYTHPSDSTESMDKFVQALMSARDKLAEKNYIRGRSAGGAIASKKMQPILDSLVKERDEALAKLAQVQSAVPAGMALARAEVAFHRETLIAVSKFLADRSRTAPQGT